MWGCCVASAVFVSKNNEDMVINEDSSVITVRDLINCGYEKIIDPAYAAGLYWHDVKKSRAEANHDRHPVFELDLPAAA